MRFRIDLKIFVFLVLFYFTKQIEVYSLIMIFAFIHEIGHLIAGLLVGMKPEKMEIMPFGVSISFKMNIDEFNKKIKNGNVLEIKKIIVAIAGPLTNFLIILITSNLQLNIIKSTLIMYTNFLIMIFNLLPIYPLDGGRILKSTLHIILGKRGAEKYINIVSKVIVIFITIASSIIILYVHNVAIVLINIYLWFLVVREDVKIKKREDIYKKILENSVV